jgi:hypothetical protein
MTLNEPTKTLILHIAVPGVWADDLPESARIWSAEGEEPTPEDYLNVVLEEWFRPEVGLTVVTQPGEKNMNDDFMVRAFDAHIVGAEMQDKP